MNSTFKKSIELDTQELQAAYRFITSLGVVAFGSLADELGKYSNSATVRVSGIFKSNNYTKKDGTEVEGYQITAEGIAGVKAAHGKYRDSKPKPDSQANQATESFYDDALPESF